MKIATAFLILAVTPSFAFDSLDINCRDLSFGAGDCIHSLVKENQKLQKEVEDMKQDLVELRSYAYETQNQVQKLGGPGRTRTVNPSRP